VVLKMGADLAEKAITVQDEASAQALIAVYEQLGSHAQKQQDEIRDHLLSLTPELLAALREAPPVDLPTGPIE
jgi:hypothetical protein